jgi:hypothetical protein
MLEKGRGRAIWQRVLWPPWVRICILGDDYSIVVS